MTRLNYHHLYYFRAVARQGNLTRAAEQLRVAQSALSTQIRQLEEQLGQPLFLRQGRSLALTEAGRIALGYAEQIFSTGDELLATLRDGRGPARQVLRLGAVATLSRNFQESFVTPLLKRDDVELVLQSGSLGELLSRLAVHTLDLVLSNRRVHADAQHEWRCERIARQQVSLVGEPRPDASGFCFPEDLRGMRLIVPGPDSEVRAAFDVLCDRCDLRPSIVAEVDDMALLRLLARDAGAAAVVPTVVVRDELRAGTLEEYCALPGLFEDFFAISIKRQYAHPLLGALLSRSASEVLAMDEPQVDGA